MSICSGLISNKSFGLFMMSPFWLGLPTMTPGGCRVRAAIKIILMVFGKWPPYPYTSSAHQFFLLFSKFQKPYNWFKDGGHGRPRKRLLRGTGVSHQRPAIASRQRYGQRAKQGRVLAVRRPSYADGGCFCEVLSRASWCGRAWGCIVAAAFVDWEGFARGLWAT